MGGAEILKKKVVVGLPFFQQMVLYIGFLDKDLKSVVSAPVRAIDLRCAC